MASESQTTGSVFDILYADTRRLSSLLSQLSNDDGIVTELVRGSEASSETKVGLSVKVISADGSETGKETTSRKMDPQWLLPLLFLDEAQDLIHRDITAAAIGSLVLASGKLIVTDLRILQEMWKSPNMRKFILQQGKPPQDSPNRQARRSGQKSPDTSQEEAVLDILPFLPHSPQVNIVTNDFAVWATIEPSSLAGTVEDLVLKHGTKVAGSWSMVGILDARPWEERDDDEYDEWLTPLERIRIGMSTENIWKVATELAGHVRTALGRPYLSYAVTPLIIFREVETLPAS